MNRVLVLGIDGGTFNILGPLAKSGKLPNIHKLIKGGVSGILESTIPPMTAPAWASFATGKNPGKHGCYEFLLPRETLNQWGLVSSEDINGETFYEIMDREGRKCVLINLPCSHPPRIKKTLITSWLTKGPNFFFPPDLVERIPELKNYRHVPDASLHYEGKLEDYYRDVRNLERTRFICAQKLFKSDWDFFFFLFDGSDRIQHVGYGEMLNQVSKGEISPESEWLNVFRDFDGYVGWFLENIPKDTSVFLISDHGFHQYRGLFFLNKWLRNEGYLKVKLKSRTKEPGTIKNKLSFFLAKHEGFRNLFYKALLISSLENTGFGARLIDKISYFISSHFTVDLSKTVAQCTTNRSVGIYINDKKRFKNGVVDDEEYERVRGEIIKKLRNLTEVGNDEPLFKKVGRKEEFYSGERITGAPDIIFELNAYWIKREHESPVTILDKEHNHHSKKGIFVAYGPDIKNNVKVDDARIIDLAPTILHIMEIPVPEDMDGKVLKEILKDDSKLVSREVMFQKPKKKKEKRKKIDAKDEEKILERLRALGYLG